MAGQGRYPAENGAFGAVARSGGAPAISSDRGPTYLGTASGRSRRDTTARTRIGDCMKRDFLAITDFSSYDLEGLLALGADLKSGRVVGRPLAGKEVALIFTKQSTRTRVSFEVGVRQLGGGALFLSGDTTQMGRGEPIRDTARVLSRYVDGIMIRTFSQADVEELARWATIPVINGLTDLLHPCQVMADVMTGVERLGVPAQDLDVAWVGDGNNMANSWLNAARMLGFRLRLACPEGYDPDPEILAAARQDGAVELLRDPAAAVAGANVITTDVWTSMGQEAERIERERAFQGFLVDGKLMARGAPEAIFLHCLPAHRGEEVTDEVMEGPQSAVFDEAENRLHIQKAILMELLG